MNTSRTVSLLRMGVALAVAGTAPAMLAASATSPTTPNTAAPLFSVPATMPAPQYRSDAVSSSSDSSLPLDTVAEERASLFAGMDTAASTQYHRTYGRSRYQDRLHNADGSSKVAFMAGAGLNIPVSDASTYYNPNYDVAVGAGVNFNRHFGILGEFRYDRMGVASAALNYQYNNYIQNAGATSSDLTGLDANAHILSLTVDPVVNLTSQDRGLGAYVVGGVGYYRKTTNFTLPQQTTACYYFCSSYFVNSTFDGYTANGFGLNVGGGLSYKMGEFSNARLFTEARYHWMDINSSNNTDFFPFNRRKTSFIPITVGVRF